MSQGKHLYEFGPFHIDTVERLLFRGEDVVPLTPKAVETLLALVSNPGRVLEKQELMKLVWGDTFVEEGGLTRNISFLRKVFEEDGGDLKFIETIPKRGYRFVAPVKESTGDGLQVAVPVDIEDPAPDNPPPRSKVGHRVMWMVAGLLVGLAIVLVYFRFARSPATGTLHASSLVVLPLRNPSNDPAQEYFTEGMTEQLINTLARIQALRVISRTSAMTYKGANKALPQIARELNVDAVVEGSVMQSGGRVRITVQLLDATTDRQLWAQSYEQDLSDVLTLQSEVATSIAREIQVKLTARDKQQLGSTRTVDPEAYLAYSYGRYYWNKRTTEGYQKAIENFNRAIAKDPKYAPPYAGLADVYALLGSMPDDELPPREVMPKAKAAALEAVRLDETLAEGHVSLGYAMLSYDWDLSGAEREFKRAIELNPGYATAHSWYAHYFLARAQPDQALEEMKRAQVQDPLSVVINMGVGWCLYHAHRYDEAIEQYRATLDMSPNFADAHGIVGMAYEQKQLYSQAAAEFQKALDLSGNGAFAMAGLAREYALSGKHSEARQLFHQLQQSAKQRYVPGAYFAVVHAALGEKEQAIEWTRRAYDERSDYMVYLRTEPWADSLRSDPRFAELLQRVARGH